MIKTISDKNERVLSAVIIIVLLGYFAVFGIINFAGFVRFCTPDMYEDTLVARLMWEQKTLFPENYVFGNQFYVVATPALSALFYGLTGSMNTSMELATTVMSLLILVSLDWLLRPFVRKRLIRLCSLLMVVAVVSVPDAVRQDEGQLFFIMASFYACYTISYFVIMGDYIRAFGDGRLRPVPFVLSLFLCFCTGMQSLRQTCISILPILAFELCAAVYRKIRTGRFYSRGQYMTLIRAAAYAAANLCGLVLIRTLDVCQQTIYLHGGASADAVTSGTLRTIIDAMRCVTGFDYAQGFGGFFIVTFIFNTGTVLYAAVLVLRALKKGPGAVHICWMITAISIAGVILAAALSLVYLRRIYVFMYYFLVVFSLVIILEKCSGRVRTVLILLFAVIASCNIYFTYWDNARTSLQGEPTDPQRICEYAVENGYELVYGDFAYSAPSVAVWSDGALIAGCWDENCIFKVIPYINIQTIYYLDDFSRAIFVFRTCEYDTALFETEANGTELTVLCEYGDYIVCSASKQLMYPITENWYYTRAALSGK